MLTIIFTLLAAGIFMGMGVMLLTIVAWILWTFLTPED
jgi:hypothetical protein